MIVSALLTPGGPPAEAVRRWADGQFDLVASPLWLEELYDVVGRPKFARSLRIEDVAHVRSLIVHQAVLFEDPPAQPGLTPDPDDDYLVAIARAAHADLIVSGDSHLTSLVGARPPVVAPRAFVALLQAAEKGLRG